MVDWHLGTIGFTYTEWKGNFYPAGLPASQFLNFYARAMNAVEINTTFYGLQSPEQMMRWVAATPPDFRFCLKAPKRITHDMRLQNCEVELHAFLDSVSGLGDRLGAILFQLPPSLAAGERPTLELFLKSLPRGPRYVLEMRHPSWYDAYTGDLLSEHGVCWAATDYEDLPQVVFPTTDFLYIRWIAKHNVIPHPGYEVIDRTERLRGWLERIDSNLDGIQSIFGFFDNDYAGHAPATCSRLKILAGLNVPPSAEQGRLF